MASVTLQNITRRFGNVTAVDDVSLEVRDREFLVLVGPSGCGKTTLLRLIAGLDMPTEGAIFLGDRLVNDVPAKDRDIAMVFQNYALYPHMHVFDNMSFALKLRGTAKAEIAKRVSEAAAILEIDHLLHRKPKELSGGERQRVALGRAIVRQPQVFLMDEPLSNLDAQLRVQTRAELIRLHRRLQITVIYVTHDQIEAMTMGDRIAVLKDGVLQQVDEPQTLYDTPANLFVGGFIGSPSMNFFHGRLAGNGASPRVEAAGFTFDLPPERARALAAHYGSEVVLGVRPHDMELAPPGQVDGRFSARVDVVETLGSEKLVHLQLGEQRFVVRVEAHTSVRVGDEVTVQAKPRLVQLFDAATGAVLP